MSLAELIADAPDGATHYKAPIGYYQEVGGRWWIYNPARRRWSRSAHADMPNCMIELRPGRCATSRSEPGLSPRSERDSAHADNALIRHEDDHEALTFGPLPGKGRAAGLKFDADKPRMELLIQGMPRALEAVGQVLTFGAQKYAAHSWRHVEDNTNRYWAAKSRHELARAKGETHDPETGMLHLAHEATNALFLLELALMEDEQ